MYEHDQNLHRRLVLKKSVFFCTCYPLDYIQSFSGMPDSCISVVREIDWVKYIFLSTLQNKGIQMRDRLSSDTVPVKLAL